MKVSAAPRWIAALAVALVSGVAPARASLRTVSDAELASASAAAVHGRVVAVESRWDAPAETIYTYVTIDVFTQWGATLLPSRVVLKQLGGRVGEIELSIGGQPQFVPGEEALVFLEVRPRDGTLYVAGLEQGKWELSGAVAGGTPAATRPATAHAFTQRGQAEARSLDQLQSLVSLVGTRVEHPVAVPPELAGPRPAAPAWTHLITNAPARWHEADAGQPVYVDSQTGGHPQYPDGGLAQLARAQALWSSASSINLLTGTSRGPRCFSNSENDRRISVSYGDPCNEIDDASSTLAYGGLYYVNSDTRPVNGTAFRRAVLGMVVTDNVARKFQNFGVGCYEQLLAHELGHAIGFGHSPETNAVMYFQIGRCGSRTTSNPLSQDDLNGLAAIYPVAVPNPPQNLSAIVSGQTITASWQPSPASRVGDYLLEIGSAPGAAATVLTLGTATSHSASAVPIGDYYLRVRARNAGGTSTASNEVLVSVAGGTPAPSIGPPTAAYASASGSTVTVQWTAPPSGAPSGYVLEAGSAPGLANIAALRVTGTVFSTTGVPPGTYYLRVRSVAGSGVTAPSNEVPVVVSAGGAPGPPSGLNFTVTSDRGVGLWWVPPATGGAVSGYQVEAGSAPGMSNLAAIRGGIATSFETSGVPPGTYYVRVRGFGSAGTGAASNEVVVTVR